MRCKVDGGGTAITGNGVGGSGGGRGGIGSGCGGGDSSSSGAGCDAIEALDGSAAILRTRILGRTCFDVRFGAITICVIRVVLGRSRM